MMRYSERLLRRLWGNEQRYCSRCLEPVHIEVFGDGSAAYVCDAGCGAVGHVSEHWRDYVMMRHDALAMQAAQNYPELADAEGVGMPSAEEIAADAAALWG